VVFLTCFILIHPAISDESTDEKIPLNQYGIRSTNPYVVDRFIQDGKSIDKVIVPSRPSPPVGFIRQVTMVPEPDIAAGTNIVSNVPALTWCFGCAATSAAMMYGHYDNIGYPNMYAGPTGGGVFPMTNATWGTALINGETRALCPLSATRQGLDGRTIKGHADDYWITTDDPGPDPFIGNWTEHTYGECTGDYMGTNQSLLGNRDGATNFFYYSDGAPLYDHIPVDPFQRDGCHGLRLFAESRGYTVQTNFSQYIYGYGGNTQGFTFADFKSEIDAGRPVLIHVQGHTMLGYGYNDTGSTVYIHDTWDYFDHSMVWGGSYGDMEHYAVSVLRLAASGTTPIPDIKANGQEGPISVSSGTPVSITVRLNPGSYAGQNADWWVAESAPDGLFYYFDLSSGSMVQGLLPTYQGPLFSLASTQLLNRSDLTVGTHTFYFGVDLNMNGLLDMNSIYYDSVIINVTGP